MSSQSVFPSDTTSLVESHLREVPGSPAPGVLFRDITPLMIGLQALKVLIEMIVERYRGQVNTVVGLESRRFIFNAPLVIEMDVGMLTMREGGRLPSLTARMDYGLEYGLARMELQPFMVTDGRRVLMIDDVLATGETTDVAFKLIEGVGGIPTRLYVLIGSRGLGGRERFAGREVDVVLTY